jgi:TRAP-type C4-dicarboxylate transport system substrate-binding protein
VGYTAGFFVFMNLDKWNALPGDVQKVMDQVSAEWIPIEGEAWDKLDKMGKDFTIKKGNKIIPLSDAENARWKNAVQPVIQMYIDDKKKMGLPAEKYVETLQGLVQKYAQ